MKKYISVFTIMVMIFLAACSNQNTSSTPTSNENNTQSNSVTKLDEGVWPANEYTEGLPVAPGTVAWATLDTEHENCNINLTGISENDYNEYMELLNQEGFSVIENVSEEIEGENYVSIGTLLSNSMRNRIVKVTEVVVRSAFYIISNYVFVSMGLSFHTQWISILFLLSMVWSTIDYGKSINEITEKKVIAELLCICCIALSIAIAYFVGYIQGTFVFI